MLLIDADHVHRVTRLKRYEAETFLDLLLAIKWLLDQIDLEYHRK